MAGRIGNIIREGISMTRENRYDRETGEVLEHVQAMGFFDLEGSVDEVMEVLRGLKRHGDKVELSCENYEWDEGKELVVWVRRGETDKEKEVRLGKEAEQMEKNLAWKRSELERLKKELEEK